MKLPVYNLEGKEIETLEVSDKVFGIEPNENVLFETIIMQRSSLRQGTQSAKTRAEVRGGGRKPWRQKGTGRARIGSIRAPHWRGGGVIFAPKPRSYKYSMPKKMRQLALKSALSLKAKENKIYIVKDFDYAQAKTKEVVKSLKQFGLDKNRTYMVATVESNIEKLMQSSRNISNVRSEKVDYVNALKVVDANALVMSVDAIQKLEGALE